MTNLGQFALTIVGTVAGAALGNPELGLVAGSLAGSILFPTQLPPGPQLTDDATTTASIGVPTPFGFGTFSVSGTVIYLGTLIQTTENSSKGGPNQTTYQYNQTIALGLCEAPIDLQTAIAGVLRIWENGTLVYDIRPQQAYNTQTGQVAETDEQYAQRLAASATYAETFTLYLGSETQEVDPTLEAAEGVGNVQPFAGLAYIVYPNRLLQTAQGWRHPSFQFEVYESGTGQCTSTTEYSQTVLYPWDDGGPTANPVNSNNVNTYSWVAMDSYAPGYPFSSELFTDLGAALAYAETIYGFDVSTFLCYGATSYGTPAGNYGFHVAPLVAKGDTDALDISMVPQSSLLNLHFNWKGVPADNFIINGDTAPYSNPAGFVFWDALIMKETTSYPTSGSPPPLPSGGWLRNTNSAGGSNFVYGTADAILNVFRTEGVPANPCEGLPSAPDPDYCVAEDGTWIKSGTWSLSPVVSNGWRVLQVGSGLNTGGNYQLWGSLGPVLPTGSPNDNEAYWVAAYNAAVAAGTMQAGKTYEGDGSGDYPKYVNQVYQIDMQICDGAGSGAKVSDIISAICQRATLNQIDVTDMAAIEVDGYAITAQSTAVDALNPLRSVAFYDAVESGLTLRFQSRGKPIVATLTTDEIGAYDGQTKGDTVPPSLSVVRALDSDLPKQIRLHYSAVSRDYQTGEQDSPFRPTSLAVNVQDVTIPISLGDTQALQAAEILWADAWNGRTTYTLSVDQSWSQLEVGDCIAIPVEGFTVRVRITKDQNSGGVLRQLTCVSDDERSYTSIAIAAPSGFNIPILVLVCPTLAYLMDLPCLQDSDATAGFYVAASRIWGSGNTWRGTTFYKSVDGGVTYATLFSIINETTAGTINAAVPASGCYTWDTSTTITVNVEDDSLSFESRTDDAVLAGANAAAMGADGRWEIIQFATATKVATKQWQLSRLLRGRRGTEHVVGSSQANDAFVMLVSGNLARVPLNSTEIGNLDDYKAVTIGASFSAASALPFTGRGVALKPFSPVDIAAHYETDGNILITWFRRDKEGGTLMSGVDIPNTDPPLTFQVDILEPDPSSPEIVKRTLTVTTTQAIYTAADAIADFGSSGPTHLRVAIYQMSAIVGRGTPGTAIIDLGDSP